MVAGYGGECVWQWSLRKQSVWRKLEQRRLPHSPRRPEKSQGRCSSGSSRLLDAPAFDLREVIGEVGLRRPVANGLNLELDDIVLRRLYHFTTEPCVHVGGRTIFPTCVFHFKQLLDHFTVQLRSFAGWSTGAFSMAGGASTVIVENPVASP
jgi:hypothetical protein